MAAIASLGGKGAFIGKVRDDRLGRVYRSDLTGIGVRFDTPEATSGPGTGRCLIVVTADGQRTMATYLGIAVELGPDEVDPRVIADAKVTYLEGYLFDPPLGEGGVLSGPPRLAAPGGAAGRLSASPTRSASAALPRGVPRTGRRLGGYPVRERGRNLLAVPDRGLRLAAAGGSALRPMSRSRR